MERFQTKPRAIARELQKAVDNHPNASREVAIKVANRLQEKFEVDAMVSLAAAKAEINKS